MFTLIGWSEQQDTGGVLTYVAGLPDQHVRVEGDNIIVPAGFNNLLGAFALGANLTDARIEAPSLRRTVLLDLPALSTGAANPVFPVPLYDAFYSPLPLDENEPLRALVAESASGAERETVLVWLGDGPQSPVTGEIYTVAATSATTCTAYTWTNGSINFVQTLPAGRYAVVGMHVVASNLIAARLVFVGGWARPGVIGCTSRAQVSPAIFRRGALGVWGEFSHDQPPTIDFLTSGACTSQTIWLDLVKTA